MNKKERLALVKSMEFIMRNLNDESLFMSWLGVGVADGDIEYGNMTLSDSEIYDLEYYLEDDNFQYLIETFLRIISRAKKSGIYCDGVLGTLETKE